MNNSFNDRTVIAHFQDIGIESLYMFFWIMFCLLLMARSSEVYFSVVEMRISKTVIEEIDQNQKKREGGS